MANSASIPRAIGIDLGTTNSVMAVMRGGEPKVIINKQSDQLTPSAVSINRRGEVLVGRQAKNNLVGDVVLSVKRFMGLPYAHEHVQEAIKQVSYQVSEGPGGEVLVHFNGHTYSPPEISAMILHKLRTDAQDRLGEPVGRAVITVPAYFSDTQVAATHEAGRMAGFTVLRIVKEPTAAALAFGLDRHLVSEPSDIPDVSTVLVYDLGGGTFDISVLMMMEGQYHVMGIEGDKFLGGDNFDHEIVKHMAQTSRLGERLLDDQNAKRLLKSKAEEYKKELSEVSDVLIEIPAVGSVDIETELTRAAFNRMIKRFIDRTLELTEKALRDANVTIDLVDHILLVGGSTLIPVVHEVLRQRFGDSKIMKNIDPMLCVAFGAAVQTAILDAVDCPNPTCLDESGKPTRNPLDATACERCGTSLVGFDTVLCPNCHLPNDASIKACRKCRTALQGGSSSTVMVPGTKAFWKCPNCDFAQNPDSATQCEKCRSPRDKGGKRCSKGHVNPPGREFCEVCNERIGSTVIDVTPENIGVELQSGRMAVLIPKGTPFDTPEPSPHRDDFPTVVANQRQLEVVVRQGPHAEAALNEYLGEVVLDLPDNLPKGALVTISLGLDRNGMGAVSVQLREYPNIKAHGRFRRIGQVSGQTSREREEVLNRADELAGKNPDVEGMAELKREAEALRAHVADAPKEDWARLQAKVEDAEKRAQVSNEVTAVRQYAQFVLNLGGEYIGDTDKTRLEQLLSALDQAIARGQSENASRVATDLTAFLDEKPVYGFFAECVALSRGNLVSASLAARIGTALSRVKSGADIDRSIGELIELRKEAYKELEGRGGPIIPRKPGENR